MSERYLPTRDQLATVRAIGESLASILPLSRLQGANEETAETWTALRNLGVFDISTPEERGGSGLGAVEEALIAFELGRRVVTPSVLATLGAAPFLPANRDLGTGSDGRAAAGYRRDDRVIFAANPGASLLLVRSESGAALFAMPGSTTLVDQVLWSSELREATGLGEPLAEASPADTVRLRLIDAASLAGLAQVALDMAVQYAGVREQFGRPIGSFQAVKHQCANMALAAACARDQASFAAVAVDDGREDAALQVECAFFVAASAALENSAKNIQIHGGIGFSEEAAPHRLVKRARVLIQMAGGLEASISRIGECPPALGASLTSLTRPPDSKGE
jgi:alkylation response protein AidB-like acyl-CoA dehydrogenase